MQKTTKSRHIRRFVIISFETFGEGKYTHISSDLAASDHGSIYTNAPVLTLQELSKQLGDDKSLAEHLKLPIQRINDYQLLFKVCRHIRTFVPSV